ncbi:MAG: hypothetical protein LBI92_02390 [Azoarcus sp.]|jgi:hypothetical protein|nr:hypothetical protein [Azoarcus sp.]
MPKTNLKLQIAFEFEIAAPEAMLADDHAALCRKLSELLGPIALQGMPTITGKQLAKAGASIIAHHYHLNAENLSIPAVDRAAFIAAAPHLTDAELARLRTQVFGKTPSDADELRRFLRKQSLALVNEYRLVPCKVEGKLKSGGNVSAITVDATLNLTNGSVMVGEEDRQNHLLQGAGAVTIVAAGGAARFTGNCEGHTLSGPLINVSIADIAGARDALIQLWQANN